jgi:hypothetical protein
MILATIVLSAAMASQPGTSVDAKLPAPTVQKHTSSIELHSMTDDEKRVYPGRERFDKTEWYESCFKSIRSVIAPEHVDEWKNGGIETT